MPDVIGGQIKAAPILFHEWIISCFMSLNCTRLVSPEFTVKNTKFQLVGLLNGKPSKFWLQNCHPSLYFPLFTFFIYLSFSPFLSLFPSFSPSFSLFLPLFHIVLLTFHSFLFQYFCVKTFLILLTTSCFILSRKSISAGSR